MLRSQIVNQRLYDHSQLRKNQKSIRKWQNHEPPLTENVYIRDEPKHSQNNSNICQHNSRDKVVIHAHDFPSRKGRTSPPQMVRVQIPSATSTNRL